MSDDDFRISSALLPRDAERRFKAYEKGLRFSHYTSATAVVSMIQNREVWMRNALSMNDWSEVAHGIQRVTTFFGKNSKKGDQFWSVIDGAKPSVRELVAQSYDGWLRDLRERTFMTCVSEHDGSESAFGRLSMWRAYGGKSPVAVIINGSAFTGPTTALRIFSCPVEYLSDAEVDELFASLAGQLTGVSNLLAVLPLEKVVAFVYTALVAYSLCLKHPSFREEREWRIIHLPSHFPSKLIKSAVVFPGEHPHEVYKIPLADLRVQGSQDLSVETIFDSILIGPTQYPLTTYQALCSVLREEGITHPDARVVQTNIPLRV